MEDGQRALREALLRPEAYPFPVEQVEFLQTHISMLFFAGDRVYKVKKAVDLGFLDFTTLASREHYCREELRLNRRLAPEIYCGVLPITRGADGRLRVGGEGPAVDYAVEMLRLPAGRMMDRLLDRGELDNVAMSELAILLADFHASAATGPGVDELGSPEVVRGNALENFDQTLSFVGPVEGGFLVSERLHRFLRSATESNLDAHARLLEQRVREGRIRDGHGDLHAGNICYTQHGIVIYDCIEFAARFRCGDVAADLAFLAMDLDLRCFRAFAAYLVRRYAERAGDEGLREILSFYKGYRAMVRAKVAGMRSASAGLGDAERHGARLEAMRYFHLAASYALPCALVLTCGLPGTGKSWAARNLARPFEAVVLRSDIVRKVLAGIAPTDRAGSAFETGLYSPAHTSRTYARLLESARTHLREGRTVVVDAAFAKQAQREPFLRLARELAVPAAVVHMSCPEPVVLERLERRKSDPHEISDADFDVYLRVRDAFETPEAIPPLQRLEAESGGAIEDLVSGLLDRLVEQAELLEPARGLKT